MNIDGNEFLVKGIEVDLVGGGQQELGNAPIEFEKKMVSQNDPEKYDKYPILNWRETGNYEEINLPSRSGPGEYGAKVTALSSEKEAVAAAIKEFGFNMVNSDKISLDRLPKDLRHQE